jgi:hypothetical protein
MAAVCIKCSIECLLVGRKDPACHTCALKSIERGQKTEPSTATRAILRAKRRSIPSTTAGAAAEGHVPYVWKVVDGIDIASDSSDISDVSIVGTTSVSDTTDASDASNPLDTGKEDCIVDASDPSDILDDGLIIDATGPSDTTEASNASDAFDTCEEDNFVTASDPPDKSDVDDILDICNRFAAATISDGDKIVETDVPVNVEEKGGFSFKKMFSSVVANQNGASPSTWFAPSDPDEILCKSVLVPLVMSELAISR